MIYLDQAATSYPKPDAVVRAVAAALTETNANPGRGSHRQALAASRLVFDARETAAEFFGLEDSSRICFTSNATGALNLALYGLARAGTRILCSAYEHNSVWRPLHHLAAQQSIEPVVIPPGGGGTLDLDRLETELAEGNVSLVALTHASNVSGEILPVAEAGRLARRHGVPILVDASQTAGHLPINLRDLPVDLLACSGHKGLLGPQGTGLLLINANAPLPEPLLRGGTGGNSEEPGQPDILPDRYESGTLNTPGIAGLAAAVKWLQPRLAEREKQEQYLADRLIRGLEAIDGLKLLRTGSGASASRRGAIRGTGTVSFRFDSGAAPGTIAEALDRDYAVLSRSGLHCAPLAHRTLRSLPDGAVRLSLSADNTEREIDVALEAVSRLVRTLR